MQPCPGSRSGATACVVIRPRRRLRPASSSRSRAAGARPTDEPSPTAYLARRSRARRSALDGARRSHGRRRCTATRRRPCASRPRPGRGARRRRVRRPGDRPAPASRSSSRRPTACRSCSRRRACVGAAHAGWRGSAQNVGGRGRRGARRVSGAAPVDARGVDRPVDRALLLRGRRRGRGAVRGRLRRARCCGGDASASICAAVNARQLAAAGVPRDAIAVHPACTKCGGEKFAS